MHPLLIYLIAQERQRTMLADAARQRLAGSARTRSGSEHRHKRLAGVTGPLAAHQRLAESARPAASRNGTSPTGRGQCGPGAEPRPQTREAS